MSDDDEDVEVVGISLPAPTAAPTADQPVAGGMEVAISSLKFIWDCPMIVRSTVDDKKGWMCRWCNKSFTPEHATRAIKHVLKIKGGGVSICTAVIQEHFLQRYRQLYTQQSNISASRKQSAEGVEATVSMHQESATQELLVKRSGGTFTIPSLPPMSASASSFFASSSKKSSFALQPSLGAAIKNTSDIRKSNNASVEMAIADFFHCENISDRVVESTRFIRLLKLACTVGEDFKMPSRSKIGGELLNLNYEVVYNANKAALCKEAHVFGLSFLGDGATIK